MRAIRSRRGCVLILMLSAGAAGCDLVTGAFSSEASDEWRRSYSLASGEIEIINVNGAITLDATTESTVEVVAERRARAASDEAARDLLRRIEIRDQVDGNHVRIETRAPSGGFWSGNTEVTYTVRVPRALGVVLRTTNGTLAIRGLHGKLQAATVNGSIEATDIAGAVEGNTVNGAIALQLAAIAADGVRLETTNGGIDVTIPRTADADLHARVTNGSIDLTGLAIEHTGEDSRRRLDARLGKGGPALALETVNGGIDISGR